tara:strand:+ start:6149 stop:6580 length:432 start_codon:yes stop_codon:yes gene_type:complete
MNLYICTGNLTKDPELRSLNDGKAVTTLRVAVNSGRDQTIYVNVTVWDKPAENCCTYLKKGSPVTVRGELKEPRIYTARSGEARADLEVTAERFGGVEFGRSEDREERPRFTQQKPHDYRGSDKGEYRGSDTKEDKGDDWTPF